MSFLDRLTLGPARRRRRLLRRLRQLDRQVDREIEQALGGVAGDRRAQASREGLGEGLRTVIVVVVTVVVTAVAAGLFTPHLVPEPLADSMGLRPSPLGQPPEVSGPGSYRFMQHQQGDPETPVAYDPCQKIHVVLNPDQGPEGAEDMLLEALKVVSAATGLQFSYDGRSEERPRWSGRTRPQGLGRSHPVLVAFATSDEVPELKGGIAGVGGSTSLTDGSGHAYYVTGQVTLDADSFDDLMRRPGGAQRARAIVLHELGHLVGLGHVPDDNELMFARNTGRTDFGPGDRVGLAELGRGRCS